MIITENSRVIPFQVNEPTAEELKSLHIPDSFSDIIPELTKIGDSIYYYKEAIDSTMISELIGSYLAKRIGLDTVDYEIGYKKSDDTLFALSKVFYEEGYQYQYAHQFLRGKHYRNGRYMLESSLKKALPCYYYFKPLRLYRGTPFYDNNLKLIAVDLKMAQHDRSNENLQIKIDSVGTVDLAPIYDYGRAYIKPFSSIHFAYANPFTYIRYTESTLLLLFHRYPELRDYVEFLRRIPMEEILAFIEGEKKIELTPKERAKYCLIQDNNDELLDQVRVKTIF